MFSIFRDLWVYRNFVLSSMRAELTGPFIRSKLGGTWMVLNPLAEVLIYALILSNIVSAKLPGIDSPYAYSIYLMSGILAWNLFNQIVSRCLNLFIEKGDLMKKMRFPRITLPVIVIGSCLINNILLFLTLLCIFALLGHDFSLRMLWLIPLSLIVALLATGIGLILGVLNVFIRDIGQMTPILLQVWFWFTPIVYPASIIPESYRHLLNLNPMYPLTNAYQQVLVYGAAPPLTGLTVVILIATVLASLSFFMFRKASTEMVDVL